MIRHWNLAQEEIYKIYIELGKKLLENSHKQQSHSICINQNWQLITSQGIWKLPITKQYGGIGLSWDECVIAIEGLIKTYRDQDFFSAIISQFAVLYLLLQYGDETQKHRFLPKLMQGEVAPVFVKEDGESSCDRLNITILNNRSICFSIEKDTFLYSDFVNFKKLLYGVIATESTYSIVDECKNILKESKSSVDSSLRSRYQEAENNIHKSRQQINLLFTNLVTGKDDKKNSELIKVNKRNLV